jgi:hypothetical protein
VRAAISVRMAIRAVKQAADAHSPLRSRGQSGAVFPTDRPCSSHCRCRAPEIPPLRDCARQLPRGRRPARQAPTRGVAPGPRRRRVQAPRCSSPAMVVAAGREEERAGKAPGRFVEAEGPVVEGRREIEVADVQMHVTDYRTRRHAIPRTIRPGLDQALEVERIDSHQDFAIARLPGTSRAVRVHFDTETIRIRQIQRFADEMIGRSRTRTNAKQMGNESAQGGAVRQAQCEVIQAERAAAWDRPRTAPRAEPDERAIVAVCGQRCLIRRSCQHAQAENLRVIVHGSLQIADLETHGADAGVWRKAKSVRRDAEVRRGCRTRLHLGPWTSQVW